MGEEDRLMSQTTRLSKIEAARFLGKLLRGSEDKPFTPQCMTNWMHQRSMPYFKIGREVTFEPLLLEQWAIRTFARNHNVNHRPK
jgi:hypothetical protein